MKRHASLIYLFLSAFLQVALVAANTWQISKQHFLGAFIVGTLLSFVWTFNIRKIVIGTMPERIAYSFGAGFGTVVGMFIAVYFYE
jgi:multidrug transporter EmrE-like cation transporter